MKRVIPLKEGWQFGGFDPDAFSVEELLTGRLETVWRDTSVPGGCPHRTDALRRYP